jgi:hypothetical protein
MKNHNSGEKKYQIPPWNPEYAAVKSHLKRTGIVLRMNSEPIPCSDYATVKLFKLFFFFYGCTRMWNRTRDQIVSIL